MPPVFGGSPAQCPKCSKAIYAAEQVIGPGNKVSHFEVDMFSRSQRELL